MIGLLQRVRFARVEVAERVVREIGPGLLVFIGVEAHDDEERAERLLQRLLTYRMFPDEEGRMNRSVQNIRGGLLLVPQFTLAAATDKGTRASFSRAAPPEQGRRLFEYLGNRARQTHPHVAFGAFGANMQVHLINDGPVTFWLQA